MSWQRLGGTRLFGGAVLSHRGTTPRIRTARDSALLIRRPPKGRNSLASTRWWCSSAGVRPAGVGPPPLGVTERAAPSPGGGCRGGPRRERHPPAAPYGLLHARRCRGAQPGRRGPRAPELLAAARAPGHMGLEGAARTGLCPRGTRSAAPAPSRAASSPVSVVNDPAEDLGDLTHVSSV